MGPNDRAMVRNAADPQQVRRAAGRERQYTELVTTALRATMATAAGRLVMWDLLERAGVFRSIWEANAKIHYNAGRQDFGHELQALLVSTDEELYLAMETEARARKRRENRTTDATHIASAAAEAGAESNG